MAPSGSKLNLPTGLPSDLKSILPFIQRAEEMQKLDPIIAYWCLYYAAQSGLHMKSQQEGAKEFLLGLITCLESMKQEFGDNDAIDNESAGAAYVENFAFRVFETAADEDGKGKATKSTARKFIAAANFFQLLEIFEKSGAVSANAEKVRFSQWRAAAIAKAIREGLDPNQDKEIGSESTSNVNVFPSTQAEPRSHTPDKVQDFNKVTNGLSTKSFDSKLRAASPGNWSTVATPGGDLDDHLNEPLNFTIPVSRTSGIHNMVDIQQTTSALHTNPTDAILTVDDDDEVLNSFPKVHFSPSAVTTSPVKADYPSSSRHGDTSNYTASNAPVSREPDTPSKNQIDTEFTRSQTSIPASSLHSSQPLATDPSSRMQDKPPQFSNQTTFLPSHISKLRDHKETQLPPTTRPEQEAPHARLDMAPSEPSPVELSPSQIAKAQKHCRFAISALEYEDAEQARKELRAALSVLGDL